MIESFTVTAGYGTTIGYRWHCDACGEHAQWWANAEKNAKLGLRMHQKYRHEGYVHPRKKEKM